MADNKRAADFCFVAGAGGAMKGKNDMPVPTNERCERCQHWMRLLEPGGYGRCKIAENVDALMRPTKHQSIGDATDFTTAEAKTGGEYAGQLFTHSWFGCVHWELAAGR